jgi:hypothetical protein
MYLSTVDFDDTHLRSAAGRMEHDGRNDAGVNVQNGAAVGALVTTFDKSHENLPLIHMTAPPAEPRGQAVRLVPVPA